MKKKRLPSSSLPMGWESSNFISQCCDISIYIYMKNIEFIYWNVFSPFSFTYFLVENFIHIWEGHRKGQIYEH